MQIKPLNSYRIAHKNGQISNINAESLIEALENDPVTEEDSPVVQAFMAKENVSTVIEELPPEILFTAIVEEDGGNGSIATPASGRIHAGDFMSLQAIADRGYAFVSWSRNGQVISHEASFVYEMEPLAEGEEAAVFTARFAPLPVAWETEVYPREASGAGCTAFPDSGLTALGGKVSAIAIEAQGYVFDHWEHDGQTVGTNKILDETAVPLKEGEEKAVYLAVFAEV